MNRQQKEVTVSFLKEQFVESQAAFVIGYKGLTVAQLQMLRKKLREKGGRLKITKARLMKRGIGVSDMLPYFKNQIGLVFAPTSSEQIAQVLYEFAQNNKAFQIVAGCMQDTVLTKEKVIQVAQLPSREVLLGMVCGTIQAPLTGLVRVLNQIMLKPVWALKQIEATKK